MALIRLGTDLAPENRKPLENSMKVIATKSDTDAKYIEPRLDGKGGFGWSASLVALLAYLAINGFAENPLRSSLTKNPTSLQMFSAIEQLRGIHQAPKIVLVGSSLMKSPMWNADAKHSLIDREFQTYHRARWFQKELARNGRQDADVFNLSTDGATASDVYLMCDKMLRGAHCPNLIIYGVAARDMVAGLYGEREDPTFKLLFGPEDCGRLGNLFTTDVQERIELELAERLPLYKNRRALQDPLAAWGQSLTVHMLGLGSQNRFGDQSSQYSTARSNGSIQASWKRLLSNQQACLSSLAGLATKRHCSLLLVNMPMEVGSYQGTPIYQFYKQTLNECAQSPNTYLLDLADQDSSFRRQSFLTDGRHMNAVGGEHLIQCLTQWISNHREIFANRS